MRTLQLSDEYERQLETFKPVVEAVGQEKLDWQAYIETILHVGLDTMRMGIIGNPDLAIVTLRKLADLEPEIVYRLMALGWENANAEEKAEAKRRLDECMKTIL